MSLTKGNEYPASANQSELCGQGGVHHVVSNNIVYYILLNDPKTELEQARMNQGDAPAQSYPPGLDFPGAMGFLPVMLESFPQGIVIHGRDGAILHANPAAERLLGQSLEQMRGLTSVDPRWQSVHEDGSPFPGETHPAMTAQRTGKPVHDVVMGVVNPNLDRMVWLQIHAIPVFSDGEAGAPLVYATFADISARKEAEALLSLERSKLAAAVDNVAIGFVISNAQGGDIYMNETALRMHEFASAEAMHHSVEENRNDWELRHLDGQVIPFDQWPLVRAIHGDFVSQFEFDYHNLRTGRKWTCNLTVVPVRDGAGEVKLIVQTLLDTSERTQAEKALRVSEERLRLAMEGTQDAIWDWDLAAGTAFRSGAWFRMFGYPDQDAVDDLGSVRSLIHPEDLGRVMQASQSAINDGQLYEVEARMLCADGSWRWILSRGKVSAWDAQGKPVRISGINSDIHLRKLAEANLQKREAQLRESQSAAKIGTWSWDMVEDTLDWSEQTFRLFDKDPATFQPFMDYLVDRIHPEDLSHRNNAIQRGMEEKEPYHYDLRMINESGREWVMETFGHVEHSLDGKPLRISGTAQDITGRKRLEEELRKNETRYRLLTESIRDVFNATDRNHRFIYWNRQAELETGMAAEAVLGKSWFEVFGETEDTRQAFANRQACIATGRPVKFVNEMVIRGRRRVHEIQLFPMDDGVAALARDITQQTETLEALQASEEKFSKAFLASPDAMVLLDATSSEYLEVNGSFTRLFGFEAGEVLGHNPLAQDLDLWVDPEEREPFRLEILRAGTATAQVSLKRRDGSRLIARNTSTKMEIGGRHCILSILRDITAQAQAEARLRESEQEFRSLAESMPQIVWATRTDGWNIYFNQQWVDYTGLSLEESRGHGWSTPFHPEDRPRAQAAWQQATANGGSYSLECRLRRHDGVYQWWLVRGVPHRNDAGEIIKWFGTCTDIDGLKKAEEERAQLQAQLLQTQKMESLGSLAGGRAHDMNNVLAAILGLASIHQLTTPDAPLRRDLETITKACNRGAALVNSLLRFSRQEPTRELELLDLNGVVREEAALLERTTLQKVRLATELATDLQPVHGDAAALSHALMNLCVNAVDAMPQGGTLTLRTRNEVDGKVLLEVADTGTGMPQAVLDRALDPFFTTKPQGKGTGLGLSMVYTTVQAHQGRLEIQSRPGEGTCVKVHLPASASGGVPEARAETLPHHLGRRLEVLLVDDDELIQDSTTAILEALGHGVHLAASGEEALLRLEGGLPCDVVILDLNMPGLGGAGVLPQIRTLRPALPVLLATGRVDQVALGLVEAHQHVFLLAKPFSLKDLQLQLGSS